MYFSSITTEILISEVEIIWMLMPFFRQGAEYLAGDARVGAHADADHRHLGDLVTADHVARLDVLLHLVSRISKRSR